MKCAIALALMVAIVVAHAADDPQKASAEYYEKHGKDYGKDYGNPSREKDSDKAYGREPLTVYCPTPTCPPPVCPDPVCPPPVCPGCAPPLTLQFDDTSFVAGNFLTSYGGLAWSNVRVTSGVTGITPSSPPNVAFTDGFTTGTISRPSGLNFYPVSIAAAALSNYAGDNVVVAGSCTFTGFDALGTQVSSLAVSFTTTQKVVDLTPLGLVNSITINPSPAQFIFFDDFQFVLPAP